MTDGPSPATPLTGGCGCGAVRFTVSAPFVDAGYCHCRRCQHRTGGMPALSAVAAPGSVTVTSGADDLRRWTLENGMAKAFCGRCGSAVFACDRDTGEPRAIRFGALDAEPPIGPRWHQWVASAPSWAPLPDDGLPRFAQGRTTG